MIDIAIPNHQVRSRQQFPVASLFELRILTGAQAGQSCRLMNFPFVIGRERGCHFRSLDVQVSRRHCALDSDGRSLFVQDLGSRNGTSLNSRPLRNENLVEEGDLIRIGETLIRIESIPADQHDQEPVFDGLIGSLCAYEDTEIC